MSSMKSLEIDNIPPLIYYDEDNVTSSKRIIYTNVAEDCTMFSNPNSLVSNYETCAVITTERRLENTPKSEIIQDFLDEFDPNNYPNQDTYITDEQIKALNISFKPRRYQIELANLALHGHNSVVCLRTGGGKTLVAALIIKYFHIRHKFKLNNSRFKTVFIVPTRLLIEQQLNFLEAIFGEDLPFFNLINLSDCDNIENNIELADIIFCTPQKIVNALVKPFSKFSLSLIDLIIFDECHHSIKNHPYNDIMKYYHESKMKTSSSCKLPQILGLTASLGCGDNKNAFDQLVYVCANLDSIYVSFVQLNKQELNETVLSTHEYKIHEFPAPTSDYFTRQLHSIMELIEKRAQINVNKPYGTSLYMQNILQINQENKKSGNVDKIIASEYLHDFNEALRLYQDIQFEEVYEIYLKNLLNSKKLKSPSEIGRYIYDLFETSIEKVFDEDVNELIKSNKINDRNDKLKALISILKSHLNRNEAAMGMFSNLFILSDLISFSSDKISH